MRTPKRAAYVLRRFRRAIPARVVIEEDRPVYITPDGLPGCAVRKAAGPWRTSGEWWLGESRLCPLPEDEHSAPSPASPMSAQPTSSPIARPTTSQPKLPLEPELKPAPESQAALRPPARLAPHTDYWDRDEWDVALDDGRLYRIHHDRLHDTWFVEASLD